MRRLAFLLCAATAAHADTLDIDMPDVSYYFVGSSLTVEGDAVTMDATAYAIGDHGGEVIKRNGFDSVEWAWSVSFQGIQFDGTAMCEMTADAPDVRLICEP